MILVHLIAGMVFGMICAVMLWLFDYPLWLMLLSYPLAGGLGLFASALVGHASIWPGSSAVASRAPQTLACSDDSAQGSCIQLARDIRLQYQSTDNR